MLYCNDADWARATGRPNRVSVFQAAIPDHSQNYVRVQFSVTHDFHPFPVCAECHLNTHLRGIPSGRRLVFPRVALAAAIPEEYTLFQRDDPYANMQLRLGLLGDGRLHRGSRTQESAENRAWEAGLHISTPPPAREAITGLHIPANPTTTSTTQWPPKHRTWEARFHAQTAERSNAAGATFQT